MLIHSPFIPVLFVVTLLGMGWHSYTAAESQLNQSSSNIMPNAGLDSLDVRSMPTGWQFMPADSQSTAQSQTGYQSPHQLVITNHGNPAASTTLVSPSANVEPGKTYLYKGFYQATLPFDLILQSTARDGSVTRELVHRYDASKEWTTVSHLLAAAPNVRSVAFVYRTNAPGTLHVDNTYLEPDPTDVTPPPAHVSGTNLLPTLSDRSEVGWTATGNGDLHMSTDDAVDAPAPTLRMHVDRYKSGDAGWESAPYTAHGNQAFQLQTDYKSDAPVDIVADYTLTSGKQTFDTLATLMPAADWVTVTQNLETPSAAVAVSISLRLHSIGTLETRGDSLIDTSKKGTPAWPRSLLSITFDDGWKSAYRNGVPLLAQYGYKATFYLNPSVLDTESFMSSQDVDALVTSGHEIASHGYQHIDFTTVTPDEVTAQLSRAADYFHQVRHMQTVQFATPFGTSDSQVNYAARKYYASLRTTDDGINTHQNFDPYHLVVLYVGNDTPPAKLAQTIADTQALHGWLILVYHRVDTNTQGEPVIAPKQFQAQLDVIKQSRIAVIPVGAALQEVTTQPGP